MLKPKEAYREAYAVNAQVKDSSIRSMASRTIQKPHIREAIEQELDRIGVNPMYQARKLKDLMESRRKIYHNGIEIDDVPDSEVQLKALAASFKITEVISNLHKDVEDGITMKISEKTALRLLQIAAEMKKMREGMLE